MYEEKQATEEHRNKMHAEIDAWQEKLRMKEREAKEVWCGLSFLMFYIPFSMFLSPHTTSYKRDIASLMCMCVSICVSACGQDSRRTIKLTMITVCILL